MTRNQRQLTRLPNGIRILTESNPNTHSAALGLWLHNGARHQLPQQHGYAHFMEHLLFKDTRDYSAFELSRRFEAMGGNINAQTGRELTALQGVVPANDVDTLLQIFVHMICHPKFCEQDVELERDVVFQELAMLEDDPEEAQEDFACQQVWPEHPMGWQILGDADVLNQASAASMHDYLTRIRRQSPLSLVVTGNVDHATFVAACQGLEQLEQHPLRHDPAPVFQPVESRQQRNVSQSYLAWVMPAPAASDPNWAAVECANEIIAGGMTSRLFQLLREQLGLVYDIGSRVEVYSDTGLWFIQTNCDPSQTTRCRREVEQALERICRDGPSPDECRQARRHLKASYLVAQDDLEDHMEQLARDLYAWPQPPTLAERCTAIDAVSAGAMRDLIQHAWSKRAFFQWDPKD